MEGEIHVINLSRRTERWHHWEEQARKWGVIDYKRFEAFDGRDLKLTSDLKHLFRNNDFQDNPWAIGCALSHFYLWMHQFEKQLPYMVVFEDDATFSQPFKLPELPNGWDLFYFGGAPYPDVYPPGIRYNHNVIQPKLIEPQFFTTVAYMLSLEGAAKLLAEVDAHGIGKHVDRFLMDLHNKIHVFCYSPLPVYDNHVLGTDINRRPFNP